MATWINFAELRTRISLSDVIFRYYNLTTLKREGNKLAGPCPVHNGDSPRAFHADLDKNVWHCFSGCKRGGNQLDFVAAKEGIGIREAALKLQAFFLEGGGAKQPPAPAAPPPGQGQSPPTPPTTPPAPPSGGQATAGPSAPAAKGSPPASATPATADPPTNEPLDFVLELKGDHPHLVQDRKLSAETIATFGVGYCSRGILRGMIAIPIHDGSGRLIAYAGRRLKPSDIDQLGKYKFPKGFHKEQVLFNYHRATAHAPELGLILVEGFFSVLKLHDAGLPNVVASMGCEVSASQVKLLAACPEVTLIFDGNDAGWSGAEKAREQLAPHVKVRLVRLPPGMEPEDLSPKGLRWLVNGMRSLDLASVSFTFGVKAPAATPGSP